MTAKVGGSIYPGFVALDYSLAFNGIRSVALLSFYGSLAEGRPTGFELGEIPPGVNIAQAMAE